jgi:hypothetical protein
MKEAGKNLVTVMIRKVMAMEARMILLAVMTKNLKSREAPCPQCQKRSAKMQQSEGNVVKFAEPEGDSLITIPP